MVARPSVHGVVWRQWCDGDDRRYPSGGLVDAAGNGKPILESIGRLCKQASGDI